MMNDQQKECFKAVYDWIHDEGHNNQNLAALIDISFPKTDSMSPGTGDLVGEELRELIKPYLEARRELGIQAMELMYILEEFITEETKEETSRKDAKTQRRKGRD